MLASAAWVEPVVSKGERAVSESEWHDGLACTVMVVAMGGCLRANARRAVRSSGHTAWIWNRCREGWANVVCQGAIRITLCCNTHEENVLKGEGV